MIITLRDHLDIHKAPFCNFPDTSFQRLILYNLVPPWKLCHEINKTQGKIARRSKTEVSINALSFTHLLGTCRPMEEFVSKTLLSFEWIGSHKNTVRTIVCSEYIQNVSISKKNIVVTFPPLWQPWGLSSFTEVKWMPSYIYSLCPVDWLPPFVHDAVWIQEWGLLSPLCTFWSHFTSLRYTINITFLESPYAGWMKKEFGFHIHTIESVQSPPRQRWD